MFLKFSAAKRYPINRKFKLLFVDKLWVYKGLTFLLDAISDLAVELTIVGKGGNDKNAVREMISNSGTFETYSRNAIMRSKEFTRENLALSYLKIYYD